MLLGMVFRGFIGLVDGKACVAISGLRLMGRMRIVLFFVVLGRLTMMSRHLLVMVRCGGVVFRALVRPGHDSFNFATVLQRPLPLQRYR